MTNPVFGAILVPRMLERSTATVLQTWFATYIKQISADLELPVDAVKIPEARNYTNRNSFDALPGETLPKVVIVSPGVVGTPTKDGSGQYRATWRLGVGIATAAQDEDLAKLYCDVYGSAARAIMLQQGGGVLGGKINWIDEQYVDLPITNQIGQLRAANVWFSVDMENVVTKRRGPTAPDEDPYSYAVADTVDVVLNKEPNG